MSVPGSRRSISSCGSAFRWPWACGSASAQEAFAAGDLSFETTVLLGVIGGRLTGVYGWRICWPFPRSVHGEWATLPFNVLCGFVAGQLRISRSQPRRHLVVFPVCRPQHLPLDPAQPAHAPSVRMADHVLFHHRGAALCANRALPMFAPRLVPSAGEPDLVGGNSRSTPRRSRSSAPNSKSGTASAFRSSWKNRNACCCTPAWRRCKTRSIPTFSSIH